MPKDYIRPEKWLVFGQLYGRVDHTARNSRCKLSQIDGRELLAGQLLYGGCAFQRQRGLGDLLSLFQRHGTDDLLGKRDCRWVHAELVQSQP
jgi:hypothetical protein